METDALPTPPARRGRSLPEKAALAAIGLNALLTVLKLGLAWWSQSLALKVEAFHSFADIGSSLAVFWAVRAEMAGKTSPPKKEGSIDLFRHPQRTAAFFIGLFLLVVALSFARRVFSPETIVVNQPVPVSLAMLVLALLSFFLSRIEFTVGEKHDCAALTADSYHARTDMFGSLAVAAALLGESLGWSLDRLAAGVLALFILAQSLNAFGAVIRDVARKNEKPDDYYREWLWLAIQKRLPGFIPFLVTRLVRIMGGSPDSDPDRKRAGAVLAAAAAVALVAAYLCSGFFTVAAGERAIVERWGKPLNLDHPLGPGLHWRRPWPSDRERKVDVETIRTLGVGSAVAAGSRTVLWTNRHYVEEYNLLSGENILVDVGVVIHYRVSDPAAWLYKVQDSVALLTSITHSALTEEFAGIKFLDSITSGRADLEQRLAKRVTDRLDNYGAGFEILSLQLRDAHPPTTVAPDFENVVSATIEKETKINEARGYANGLIPRARGQAAVIVTGAQAERDAAQARARGDAERFTSVHQAYQEAPLVMRTRLNIETAESVLPGREKIIVPADAASGAMDLFMTADPGRAPGSSK